MNWIIFVLFALSVVLHLAYLAHGKYPREREPLTSGEEVIAMLINLGIATWIWNHWL